MTLEQKLELKHWGWDQLDDYVLIHRSKVETLK